MSETAGFTGPSTRGQIEALRRRIARLEDYMNSFGAGPTVLREIATCEAELADLLRRCEAGGAIDAAT